MRIINTIVFILFGGILSSAVVQGQTQSQRNAVNTNFFAFVRTARYEELLRKGCQRNGGPNAYADLMQNEGKIGRCIVTELQSLRAELGVRAGTRSQDVMKNEIKYTCDNISDLKDCIKLFTAPTRACVEPKYRDNVNVTYNTLSSSLNFVCQDDERRIREFIAGGGPECLLSKIAPLVNCFRQLYNDYVPAGAAQEQRLPRPLGIEECRAITNFQHCTVKTFKECKDPKPANVADSVFEYFRDNTPCRNLLQ